MKIIDLKYLVHELITWADNRKNDEFVALPILKIGDEIEYILDPEDHDFDKEDYYLSIVSAIADLDMVGLYNYKIIKIYNDPNRVLNKMQQIRDEEKQNFTNG